MQLCHLSLLLMWQITNRPSLQRSSVYDDLCAGLLFTCCLLATLCQAKTFKQPFSSFWALTVFNSCRHSRKKRQHSCTIYVRYKMRYVSFLLVHIHGNSAKPNTTTTLSKLYCTAFTSPSLVQGIWETTETPNTQSDRFTDGEKNNKDIRTVNTGRDSKQVYMWRV